MMAFLHENFMFHSYNQEDYSPYPPQYFQGVGPAPTFTKRSMSFSGVNNNNNNKYDQDQDQDLSDEDEVSQSGGDKKKIRLNMEQVKALEKSFEMGNKLEPDRKMQLARTLNLQPRQVAIWFQNRRARWRIKQLEKDYDLLKKQFEDVKVHNESLQSQNKKLHAELLALRSGESTGNEVNINPKNDNDHQGSWSNGSDDSSNFESSKSPLINSSLSSNLSFKQLFPSSFKPTSITQLLHSSSRSDLACPKMDHQMVQDGSFCNMFNGVDDQTGLWPWPEQHQYQ